jgi:hypothetical protein
VGRVASVTPDVEIESDRVAEPVIVVVDWAWTATTRRQPYGNRLERNMIVVTSSFS